MSGHEVFIDKKIAELAPNSLSQEQIEAARQEARDILDGKSQKMTPEFQQKMHEAAMVAWRLGLPGIINYLEYLVATSECPKKEFKDACTATIKKLNSSLGDKDELVGACTELKFGGKIARMHIDLCPRDHDMSEQFIKLSAMFGNKYNDHVDKIKKSMAELILFSRKVWQQVIHMEQNMAIQVQNIMANKYSENIRKGLAVDTKNSTLYIDPDLPKRLGIIVDVE